MKNRKNIELRESRPSRVHDRREYPTGQSKISVTMLVFIFALAGSAWGQSDSLQYKNDTLHLAYTDMAKQRLVGAVDVIDGDAIRHSSDFRAHPALAGLASGLYVSKNSAGPGTSWANLKVRGLSRGNAGDGPLMVIDGIPNRNLADLSMESIESVSVLKDVTAKMLYGSQAADGVILVTTKRGTISDRQLSFSIESGIKQPTALPVYLDAAAYAEKYNEATLNDGLPQVYSSNDIEMYRNQTSPLLYPDMDYYSTFLKSVSNYQRLNSTLTGGDAKTKYFLNVDYVRETGLESVGSSNSFNQLNLVSRLDYQVNDIISVNLDISSRLGLYASPNVSENTLFGSLSSHRPNSYPFFITKNQNPNTDSLAFNPKGGENIYGELTRNGYIKRQDFSSQSNLGIDLNFDQYIKGLSAKLVLGFDSYNNIYTGKHLNYATYRVVTEDSIVRIGEDEIVSTESKFGDDFSRNTAGHASINYDRNFGKHSITSNIVYSIRSLAYKSTENYTTGIRQDYKGVNLGARINYAYDNKYVIELSSSYMGSDKFIAENRYKPYGAAGAAWVLSNESFMSSVSAISYLKLKGSYGIMGYDRSLDYYIYRSAYSGAGAFYFGINNADAIDYGTRVSKIGNPDITFEEANELNAGIEGVLLNVLSFEANYFNELRTGMPTALTSTLPGYVYSVAPVGNFNEIRNVGIDLSLQFEQNFGDLYFSFGAKMMYSKATYEVYDEINIYEHQNLTGKVTDVIGGFQAEGLYTDDQDILDHGVTSSFGPIIPGDIKYTDYTNDLNDNLIDEYDMMQIGHYFPRYIYSLNLDIRYKGFALFALGQGVADVDKIKNTSYYFNYGERKYSEEVLSEDYPRLTTSTSGGHSYLNSTYWLSNGAYFKLRMLELSYDIPLKYAQGASDLNIKAFIKATDLFTITKFEKLDPEDINAGVSKYPLFRTFSVGAKFNF